MHALSRDGDRLLTSPVSGEETFFIIYDAMHCCDYDDGT
jgi:hypothetical protein